LDAAFFRVVTILGPRQSGKTTFAKKLFPKYSYANLEDPELRRLALNDPRTFLTRFLAPAIFDQVQRAPELLSYIQGIVDEQPDRKGQYILTGSHQPTLQEQISQTLDGRTSILTLLPLHETYANLSTQDRCSFPNSTMLDESLESFQRSRAVISLGVNWDCSR
jgi:hypothetical protein